MNKQELIEKVTRLPYENYKYSPYVERKSVLRLVSQLDEPQKPVVPQFVADWIDYCKEKHLTITGAFYPVSEHGIGLADKCTRWALDNQNLFARAWLDGYEVEKEPKYTVKFKATKQYLSNDELGPHFDPSFRSNFTKSDLEKLGLAEVFNSPLFEVEEV